MVYGLNTTSPAPAPAAERVCLQPRHIITLCRGLYSPTTQEYQSILHLIGVLERVVQCLLRKGNPSMVNFHRRKPCTRRPGSTVLVQLQGEERRGNGLPSHDLAAPTAATII